MNPRYHIDGRMPDGSLHGFDCARAPFAVFDSVNQYWLVTGLPWRWLASAVVRYMIFREAKEYRGLCRRIRNLRGALL